VVGGRKVLLAERTNGDSGRHLDGPRQEVAAAARVFGALVGLTLDPFHDREPSRL
jgi:hypothetical protein